MVRVKTGSCDVNIGITKKKKKKHFENLSGDISFDQGSFPLWIRTGTSAILRGNQNFQIPGQDQKLRQRC